MNIVVLKGGLGNQLFQLATYLFIIKKLKRNNNFLENNIGFILDFKYRRKYELGQIPNALINHHFIFTLLNLIILFIIKINGRNKKLFFIEHINDKYDLFKNYKKLSNNNKINFFEGYFQSFNIVNAVRKEILFIIKPKLNITNKKFSKLIERIKEQKDSVALCVRFYEETNNPSSHSNPEKSMKSFSEYNKIIKIFEKKLKNPYFFLFVQEENEFTKKLIFNSPVELITHKNGYLGSWNRLSAQSNCKNHIFNNSTFYFWGAFISNTNNKSALIYASNNFIFNTIYDPTWNTF